MEHKAPGGVRLVHLAGHRRQLLSDGVWPAEEDADVAGREAVADALADAVPVWPARILVVLLVRRDRLEVDLARNVPDSDKEACGVQLPPRGTFYG